jgi:hypothetical protein
VKKSFCFSFQPENFRVKDRKYRCQYQNNLPAAHGEGIPPFSENIFTGALSPLSYESYTKKEKKARPHEDKGENGYGI